ncbi:hypothetical protein BGZ95_007343 [Linnemannia exigua]|uniref:Uncharacterized protein n=1 Tax=Linnemannia exigua TaxID=604196 RepID=A0AAD4DFJ3_9FUNG|nr:hypothetical protein BGZ95_007343 [Linnemannia exigua]
MAFGGAGDADDDDMDLEDAEARGLLSGGLNSEDARRRVKRRGLMIPRSNAAGGGGGHVGGSEQGASPGYSYGNGLGQGQAQGGGKGRQWGPPPSYGAATRNNGGYSG